MSPIVQHSFKASMASVYEADALGAPFKVMLTGGVHKEVDPATGEEFTCIEDVPGLIAAVVESRVLHPRKLSGDDLKFIRSALAMKSSRMAAYMGFTPEHYSRCESGARVMPVSTEKMYRMSVFLLTGARDIGLAERAASVPKSEKTKENASKALDNMKRIFMDLEIDPVCDASEELSFLFHRRCKTAVSPCDDGEWESNSKAA